MSEAELETRKGVGQFDRISSLNRVVAAPVQPCLLFC